ncbi:MAG: PQQ-dependent sugar dehydrogenase [Chloroflexi bacterium]|nr:PQQ-dependent sugar dehydrogenase [Chloroflexota bacterium]
MNKSIRCLIFTITLGIVLLAACQNTDVTRSPTAVPSPTVILETAVPPTATNNPPTPTPVTETTAEPEQPAAMSTHPATATPVATDTPAATTTPLPQPVNHIQLVPIVTEGFARPLYLTHAFDDRLFIVDQPGLIYIIQEGKLLETPFLDIRDRVGRDANERGLLSVAFDPDYKQNGRFYVNYTNKDGHTVIGRYLVSEDNPNRGDPNSEEILLTINQPFSNHNGGLVKFGPDGYLYIGMGDGGDQGDPYYNGQNIDTLLGTLLRLDVNQSSGYAIPPDNPYSTEVWAIGLRNPWRFSFDRQTGDLYLADVGQNKWEYVHFQPHTSHGGQNYGWNVIEGSYCFDNPNCDTVGLELPIFEYDHTQGCSVTGGYVYRGQQFPELTGNYFAADYCTGIFWRLLQLPDGSWDTAVLLDSEVVVASFGEDMNGELYVVGHTGQIYQIQP